MRKESVFAMLNFLSRSLLTLALGLVATASLSIAQSKVGIINLQKAVLDTAEIKKAQNELEAKFKPKTDKIDVLNKELADIQNKLQTMAGKLTQQAEQEMQATGARKQREMTRLSEDVQADVDRERNEVLQRAATRMQEVVKKLAEASGLDVVVDVSNTVFFKPALEITKDSTTAYDKAYPVGK